MRKSFRSITLAIILIASTIFSGCTLTPEAELADQATRTTSPSATPFPLPALTLKSGDFYFSLNGTPGFVFSRNVAGYKPTHYDTFLDWTRVGGGKFVRIQLDSLGMGYTSTGAVDSAWAGQWDKIFDKAEAEGIYVLPVFSGWFDWNTGSGFSTWSSNPMNEVNGGPVKTPDELFQKDSSTQTLWLDWMQTLVKRWQGRKNIIAWEVFSEVNLASGATETSGTDFINTAVALIRANDSSQRPVTASLADIGTWPNFYRNTSIDFINVHPYPLSAQLDRIIVSEVRSSLVKYKRPVLIGESGLNADSPENYPANSEIGIRHAIWAATVSGAMNGRALYWEDSYGIYFPSLGIPWMQKYEKEELPAVNFVNGTDFDGFTPLTTTSTPGIWGAALGDDQMVLGWFRDAGCEPPDWPLKPVISKQTVTLSIPGTATNWRVDFYDTKNGTTILGSLFLTRQGNTLIIPLPDFQDDIAFKAHS
jgi:hypothetical protein